MIQEDKSKLSVVPYFLRKSGVATAGRGSKRQTGDKQETVMIQEEKSKLSVVPYFLRKSGVATAEEDKSKPSVVPYFLRKSGVATAGRGSKRQTRDSHDAGRQEEAFCCPVFPTEIGCSHSRGRQQETNKRQTRDSHDTGRKE